MRSHLQISRTHVLPVVFRARRREAKLCDALPLLKEWLPTQVERIHRITPANIKPGTLETPQLLRNATRKFTVWFEPTAANFALLTPRSSTKPQTVDGADQVDDLHFDTFSPTAQTLYIMAEMDE